MNLSNKETQDQFAIQQREQRPTDESKLKNMLISIGSGFLHLLSPRERAEQGVVIEPLRQEIMQYVIDFFFNQQPVKEMDFYQRLTFIEEQLNERFNPPDGMRYIISDGNDGHHCFLSVNLFQKELFSLEKRIGSVNYLGDTLVDIVYPEDFD